MSAFRRSLLALVLVTAAVAAKAETWVIPGVANTPGANGTYFQSDLSLTNSGPRFTEVTVRFLPTGGGAERSTTFGLNPRQSIVLTNVIQQLWGIGETSGALVIEANSSLAISATTYNVSPRGRFGLALSPVSADDFLTVGETGQAAWLSESRTGNVGYRTNIGLFFPGATGGTATVTIFDDTGAVAGTQRVEATRPSFIQIPAASIVNRAVEIGRISVTALRGSVHAYSAVVDNLTGDGSLFPITRARTGSTDVVLAGAGRVEGANGTFWQTDLRLYNPTGISAAVVVTFLDDSTAVNPSITVQVPAGGTVEVKDVASQFGITRGLGALRIVSTAPIVALSRTSNINPSDPSAGSFGSQQLPFDFSDLLTPENAGVTFSGIGYNASSRTNLGVVSGGNGAVVEIILRDDEGIEIARTQRTLPPLSYQQYSLLSLFGIAEIPAGSSMAVRMIAGSATFVVSIVDQQSGDPVIITADPTQCGLPTLTISAPASICNDGSYTLQWFASDPDAVVSITGIGTGLPSSGSRTFSDVTSTQTFTGSVTNACGAGPGVTQTVRLSGAATVSSFTATALDNGTSGRVALQWTTTDADSVTISGVGTGLPANGSRIVEVNQTTTFDLTASNSCSSDTVSQTATITCLSPRVDNFTAASTRVSPAGQTTINFVLANSDSWTLSSALSNALSVSSGTGSGAFSLTYTGTNDGNDILRLSTTNSCGTTTRTLPIRVEVGCDTPLLTNVTLEPSAIGFSEQATLSFTMTNAVSWTVSSSRGNTLSSASGTGSGTASVTVTAAITGNDTLTVMATNACGSSSITRVLTVAACALPTISPIVVSPTAINAGGRVSVDFTLTGATTWSATSQTGNALTPSSGSFSGPISIDYRGNNPGADVVTVTATSVCGSTTRTTAVTVQDASCPLPSIVAFSVAQPPIRIRESASIQLILADSTSWELRAATGGSITPATGTGAGTINLTFVGTAAGESSITATLRNTCGTVVQTIPIFVQPDCTLPSVSSFTSSAPTLVAGTNGSVTFTTVGTSSWTVSSALGNRLGSVSGPGPVSGTGSGTFTLPYEATFAGDDTVTVTATSACGSVASTLPITVTPNCTLPQISSFATSSATVLQNQTATVSFGIAVGPTSTAWTLTSARGNRLTNASGNGTGNFSTNFRGDVVGDDTLTLTVTNSCGTVTQTIPVTVQSLCPLPVINSFTVTPGSIQQTQSATLNFTLTSATNWTLTSSRRNRLSAGSGSGSGAFSVTLGGDFTGTDTLTLRTTNGCGSATQTVTVTVTQ